jgi:hypothetical protein
MPQLAGEDILATDVVLPRYWKKSGTETRTTATLSNDADFVLLPLAANKVYNVRCMFAFTATSTTGDPSTAFVLAGGAAQLTTKSTLAPQTATTDVANTIMISNRANITTTITVGTFTSGTTHCEQEFMVETTTAGTSGTLTLQWSNSGASGTTSLLSSSTILITEIEAG